MWYICKNPNLINIFTVKTIGDALISIVVRLILHCCHYIVVITLLSLHRYHCYIVIVAIISIIIIMKNLRGILKSMVSKSARIGLTPCFIEAAVVSSLIPAAAMLRSEQISCTRSKPGGRVFTKTKLLSPDDDKDGETRRRRRQ